MRGGRHDDAAPFAGLHARHRGADRMKRRRKVDRNDLVPLLDGKFLDRRDVLDACVVHQDVAGAELRFRGLDHLGDLGGLRHVGRRVDRLHAEFLFDAGAFLLDLGGGAESVDQHIGAVLGEGAGNTQPDARRGAGDDCVFPFKHLRSLVKWWRGRPQVAVP